jgi:toxin ParE1/3/4
MGADNYRLVWSPETEEDLISIWKWGAAEWSEDVADRHLFEIEHACERLMDDPMFGKARDELIVGVRSVPVRPHIVFYRIANRQIEIVRVLHQRMDADRVFSN